MEGLNDSDTGALVGAIRNEGSITKGELGGNVARVGGKIHETAHSMLSLRAWGLAMRRPGGFLGVDCLYSRRKAAHTRIQSATLGHRRRMHLKHRRTSEMCRSPRIIGEGPSWIQICPGVRTYPHHSRLEMLQWMSTARHDSSLHWRTSCRRAAQQQLRRSRC
jgi:hypothetical protein